MTRASMEVAGPDIVGSNAADGARRIHPDLLTAKPCELGIDTLMRRVTEAKWTITRITIRA